jgi:hypothetical protein
LAIAASFLGSSAVEQPAVNRLVAGSNPARGASNFQKTLKAHCANAIWASEWPYNLHL